MGWLRSDHDKALEATGASPSGQMEEDGCQASFLGNLTKQLLSIFASVIPRYYHGN